MMHKYLLVAMILLFCPVALLWGTVINVPTDQSTIQAGINAASNTDTVLVDDGTYQEHINFSGKAITVMSVNGPETTIIEKATDYTPLVTFSNGEDGNSILNGFTIRNATSTAINCNSSSATIINNIIEGNTKYSSTAQGAAITITSATSTAIIKHNIIRFNEGNIGNGYKVGAIYAAYSSDVVVDSNLIYQNNGYHGGGIFTTSCATSANYNLIYENNSAIAGGIFIRNRTGNSQLINNTIVDNLSYDRSAGIFIESGTDTLIIMNNIIAFNQEYGIYGYSTSNVFISYNCIYDNSGGTIYDITPGAGNIYVDPMFIGRDDDVYYLDENSPCIDTGWPYSPLDPDGSRADMGANYYAPMPWDLTMDIADVYGEQSATINIPITAYGFSIHDLGGMELHLDYSESCMSYYGYSSDYLTNPIVNAASDEIHILWEDYENPIFIAEGDTLITLSFVMLASPGTECSLEWQSGNELVDTDGLISTETEYIPGSATCITWKDMSGYVRYFSSFLPVSNVAIAATGYDSDETTTDAYGNYIFEDFTSSEYDICASYNADDAGVTVADVIAIRQHIAETNLFTSPYQMIASDVTDNGEVTISDILKIRRYLAALETLPSGNWAIVDSAYAITFGNWYDAPSCLNVSLEGSDLTNLSFIGVRRGDANHSWGSALLSSIGCDVDTVSVDLENINCQAGQSVNMPISVAGFHDVAGVEIHISYPMESIEVASINSELLDNPTLNYGNGMIHIVWEDINNVLDLNDGEQLLSLEFITNSGAPERIPITFTNVYICDEFGGNYIVGAHDGYVITGQVAVDDSENLPATYGLSQNYPNPFNPLTSIEFQLPESSPVKLTIYDIQGREVETLINSEMPAGVHRLNWHADQYPSGIYLYKLTAGKFNETKKMLLLK